MRRTFSKDSGRVRGLCSKARVLRSDLHPRQRTQRRQRRNQEQPDAVVPGSPAAGAPRDRVYRRRRQSHRLPLPGPARSAPRPGLSRIQRPSRIGCRAPRRRDRRVALRQAIPGPAYRHLRWRARLRVPAAVRSRCAWRIRSTSAAATSSRIRTTCLAWNAPVEAMVVWMGDPPLEAGRNYLLKHMTNTVRASCTAIVYRVDPDELHRHAAPQLRAQRHRSGAAYPVQATFPWTSTRRTGPREA